MTLIETLTAERAKLLRESFGGDFEYGTIRNEWAPESPRIYLNFGGWDPSIFSGWDPTIEGGYLSGPNGDLTVYPEWVENAKAYYELLKEETGEEIELFSVGEDLLRRRISIEDLPLPVGKEGAIINATLPLPSSLEVLV